MSDSKPPVYIIGGADINHELLIDKFNRACIDFVIVSEPRGEEMRRMMEELSSVNAASVIGLPVGSKGTVLTTEMLQEAYDTLSKMRPEPTKVIEIKAPRFDENVPSIFINNNTRPIDAVSRKGRKGKRRW
jgi:hypothetical protein